MSVTKEIVSCCLSAYAMGALLSLFPVQYGGARKLEIEQTSQLHGTRKPGPGTPYPSSKPPPGKARYLVIQSRVQKSVFITVITITFITYSP